MSESCEFSCDCAQIKKRSDAGASERVIGLLVFRETRRNPDYIVAIFSIRSTLREL